MIVEVAAAVALLTAGSIGAKLWWTRRRATSIAHQSTPARASASGSSRRGLVPGDVVSIHGEDHVLERASELGSGMRIFETLGARPRFLVQLDEHATKLVLADRYDGLPEGRVADEVSVGGRTLRLLRREQTSAQAVHSERPASLTGPVECVLLADRAGRYLVVVEPSPNTDTAMPRGYRLVLLGDVLDPRQVELLPGS